MPDRQPVAIGDEYDATTPDAPCQHVRICAIDNGRLLCRDADRDHEATSTFPLSVDELRDAFNFDGHSPAPVDEAAGWRRLGAKYADQVRAKREAAEQRAKELRSPEQVFAELAAKSRKRK